MLLVMAEGTRPGEMPSFEPSHSFEAQKRRFSSDGSKLRNTNTPPTSCRNLYLCMGVRRLEVVSEIGLLVMRVSIYVNIGN